MTRVGANGNDDEPTPFPEEGHGVSVVICSRNRPGQLAECLGVVKDVLRSQDQLIVVDSASDGPETLQLAQSVPGAVAVRCDRPGLSHARNAGVRVATRSVVVFTDDDCAPQGQWTAALESEFSDSEVGVVTGAVRPKGQGFTSAMVSGSRSVLRYPTDAAPMGHGANMAVRRDLLDAAGGFDEQFGAGAPLRSADDWDMFYRVLRTGRLLVYTPEAVVLHHQWRSSREALLTRYGYSLGAAALAVKLRRLGRREDRVMSCRLSRRRAAEGARATVVGLVTLKWFRMAAGVATLAGLAHGSLAATRMEVRGGCFATGYVVATDAAGPDRGAAGERA